MTSTEQQPNTEVIDDFLSHLFDRVAEEYSPDALVEFVVNFGKRYDTRYATVSRLADVMPGIIDANEKGANIYVGVNPRKPGTNIHKPGTDNDVDVSFFNFADLDSAESFDLAKSLFTSKAAPRCSFCVVTGRTPTPRSHLYYELEDPTRDLAAWQAVQRGLADKFKGDAVIDPRRIMRVAGTVSYPKPDKVARGYTVETTALVPDTEDTFESHVLAMHFPKPVNAAAPVATSLNLGLGGKDDRAVESLLDMVFVPGQWHYAVRDLCAYWVGVGRTDAEILMYAAAFTQAGYTVAETMSDLSKLITSARTKFDAPNPTATVTEAPKVDARPLFGRFDTRVDMLGDPPEMQYLCEGTIPFGVPGLITASGGVGKSFSVLDLGLRIASGGKRENGFINSKIFGGEVIKFGNVIIATAEDQADSLHRRLDALDKPNHRRSHPFGVHLQPFASLDASPIFFVEDRDGLRTTEVYDEFVRYCEGMPDLALIVIDPLQAFVAGDINASPTAGQFVWSTLSTLCAKTGATVAVCHHNRKTSGAITGPEDAKASIRGSSALIDGCRFGYSFWVAEEAEARKILKAMAETGLGGDYEYEPGKVVFGAIVKANDKSSRDVHTYIRNANGVLVDRTAAVKRAEQSIDLRAMLEQCIKIAADRGHPYTKTGAAGIYTHRETLAPPLRRLARGQLETLVGDLLNDTDRVEQCAAGTSNVKKWLDVTGGRFTLGDGEFAKGALEKITLKDLRI